jgi:pyrimidine deaminase RibD-like protein
MPQKSKDIKLAKLNRDLKFMRAAILEAAKSHGEDNRTHPKVGVVVVKDDVIISKGFRGEPIKKNRGTGRHAEYVAMEEKLSSQSIVGATVYTTLEPCTNRRHPKVPCAERLIERHVERVVIGMLDPNQNICGRGIRRLRDANIATDLFPNDLMAEVEALNRDFIREHRRVLDGSAAHNSARRRAIYGTWIGEITSFQELTDQKPSFKAPITMTLEADGDAIGGDGSFVRLGETYKFSLKGDLTSDEHILALSWNHPSPRFAFGNMILRLNDEATGLKGKAVGYGSLTEKIIVGTVAIRKDTTKAKRA